MSNAPVDIESPMHEAERRILDQVDTRRLQDQLGNDPEIWVMTPGRGAFGFFMNRRQGFFYPRPAPRLLPPEIRRLLQREERLTNDKPPVRAWPQHDRVQASRLSAAQRFDEKVLDHPPMARPRPNQPHWQARHSAVNNPLTLNKMGERLALDRVKQQSHSNVRLPLLTTDGQRQALALIGQGRYVIPIGVHPDFDLMDENTLEAWEHLEPHIQRVEASHNPLAWDRHYQGGQQ